MYLTDPAVPTKDAYLAVLMVEKMAPQKTSETPVYLAGSYVQIMAAYLDTLTVVAKDDSVLDWLDGTNNGCLLHYVDGCEDGTTEGIEDSSDNDCLLGCVVGYEDGSKEGIIDSRIL